MRIRVDYQVGERVELFGKASRQWHLAEVLSCKFDTTERLFLLAAKLVDPKDCGEILYRWLPTDYDKIRDA